MKSNRSTLQPPARVIPHHVPAHVFHIAQVAAYQQLRASLAAGSELSQSRMDELLLKHANRAWEQYCALALPQLSDAQPYPLPSTIELDPRESIPVSIWDEDANALTDAWGMFLVTPENNGNIVPLTLTSPFQPVNLSGIDEGRHCKVPLSDPRHAALAILTEILSAQLKDVTRIAEAHEDKLAWRQMQVLRAWYASVASTVFEHLPKDHLRDWGDRIDGYDNLHQSLLTVATVGMTVLAQKALAFQHLSQYFTRLLNDVDDTFGSNPGTAMETVIAVLTQDVNDHKAQLAAMNYRLLASHRIDPEKHDYVVSFPDNTRELPSVLAMDKSVVQTAKVTRLKKK